MFVWMRRLFASWIEFAEYAVFLSIGVAGVASASGVWIVTGALTLFVLGFSRWRKLIEKAGHIDAEYRELGRLALVHKLVGVGIEMYAKAYRVPLVLGAKFLLDCLYLAGAFVFGHAIRWLWLG